VKKRPKPVAGGLFGLTRNGLDRLRARVETAAPSAARAGVAGARDKPDKKAILEALARLEADYARVLA
jgi:hypothetical protein